MRDRIATVELVVKFGYGPPIKRAVDLDIAECGFDPLPRNRELPWELEAHRKASEQFKRRNAVIADVAYQLADSLLEIVKSRDTENGYPKTTTNNED